MAAIHAHRRSNRAVYVSDPDAAAYLNAQVGTGASFTPAQIDVVNSFYIGVKADGVYATWACAYLFCGGGPTTELNMLAPTGLSADHTLTFGGTSTRSSQGLVIRVNYGNPYLPTSALSPTNYTWGMYTSATGNSSYEAMSTDSTNNEQFYPLFTDGRFMGYQLGTASVTVSAASQTSHAGLSILTGNATGQQIYRNAVLKGSRTGSQGAWRGTGFFISYRYAWYYPFGFAFYGTALTQAQVTALSARVATLMAAFGR